MSMKFRPGQSVRLVEIPGNLPADTDDLPTSSLFKACLGRTFVVAEIDRGIIALDVGEVLGQPPWQQTIYVKPESLESVDG